MTAVVGIAMLVVAIGITAWGFREARRLEALLGEDVGWLRAPAALKLRMVDRSRSAYPAEWHRRARRLHVVNVFQILVMLAALAILASSVLS